MNPARFPARKKVRWYWAFIAAVFGICTISVTTPLIGALSTVIIVVIVEPVVEGDEMK